MSCCNTCSRCCNSCNNRWCDSDWDCEDRPERRPQQREPNIQLPRDFSWRAWNFDPVLATQQIVPSVGTIHFARIAIHHPVRVNNILLAITASGVSLTLGQCFAGIYDSSGTLVAATDDISTLLSTSGIVELPLTAARFLRPGTYFVALLLNGTTIPQLWSTGSGFTSLPVTYPEAMQFFDDSSVAYTSLPSMLAFESISESEIAYWTALN